VSVRRGDRQRPAEAVAGLMAAASIFVSLAAVAYRPMRIIPFTILLALIAAAIGGRQSRLAAAAVAIAALCWFAGVTLAVLIGKPLY
jgi:hypothetical protein